MREPLSSPLPAQMCTSSGLKNAGCRLPRLHLGSSLKSAAAAPPIIAVPGCGMARAAQDASLAATAPRMPIACSACALCLSQVHGFGAGKIFARRPAPELKLLKSQMNVLTKLPPTVSRLGLVLPARAPVGCFGYDGMLLPSQLCSCDSSLAWRSTTQATPTRRVLKPCMNVVYNMFDSSQKQPKLSQKTPAVAGR